MNAVLETRQVVAVPITSTAFAPFGDVIDASGQADYLINSDACGRFHDRGRLEVDADGRLGLSLFDSECFSCPVSLRMVERHPLASQTFVPMSAHPYLVIVAPDERGRPGTPLAFMAAANQSVNLLRGSWHGVLTPLSDEPNSRSVFAVVDRIGDGDNCETFDYPTPFLITL